MFFVRRKVIFVIVKWIFDNIRKFLTDNDFLERY
ncbi:MAG: hypothetical protein ACI9CD_001298 [Candidatus Deianiraeaceae bacterium]